MGSGDGLVVGWKVGIVVNSRIGDMECCTEGSALDIISIVGGEDGESDGAVDGSTVITADGTKGDSVDGVSVGANEAAGGITGCTEGDTTGCTDGKTVDETSGRIEDGGGVSGLGVNVFVSVADGSAVGVANVAVGILENVGIVDSEGMNEGLQVGISVGLSVANGRCRTVLGGFDGLRGGSTEGDSVGICDGYALGNSEGSSVGK